MLCLRNAGVSIEAIVEYVGLCQSDNSFEERWKLLNRERDLLIEQKEKLEQALSLLEYKVSRYEIAVKTGVLSWNEGES